MTQAEIAQSIENKKRLNGLLDQVLARERMRSGYRANSAEAAVGTDLEAKPQKQYQDAQVLTDQALLDDLIQQQVAKQARIKAKKVEAWSKSIQTTPHEEAPIKKKTIAKPKVQ